MKRPYGVIAVALVLTIFACVGFIVAYAMGGQRAFLGATLAFGAAALCAALTGWARWIVPDERVTDEIEDYPSSRLRRTELLRTLRLETQTLGRPRALVWLLGAALTCAGIAVLVPLRSLGPRNLDPSGTRWRRGVRLVRPDGTPVHGADLNVDSDTIVFPEGAVGDARSQATLIRLPQTSAGAVDGYVAFSRVCTHAGCPVALYLARQRQLLCPCHQSLFDVLHAGAPLAGPADRALPQLPLRIGGDGFLRADGDFSGPVGPGSWRDA